MLEPTTVCASIFSGLSAIVRGIQYGAHFAEVPREVVQLQNNIRTADRTLNTAKRLLRKKGHYLDPDLIEDAEANVAATEEALVHVRDTIEACRKDIEIKNTVSVKNRAAWLLWKNQEFLTKLKTLNTCLAALNTDILRLEGAAPPPAYVHQPEGGLDHKRQEWEIGVQAKTRPQVGFARSASRRWPGSSSTMHIRVYPSNDHKGKPRDLRIPTGYANGGEGYESDGAPSRTQFRSRDQNPFGEENSHKSDDDFYVSYTQGTGVGITPYWDVSSIIPSEMPGPLPPAELSSNTILELSSGQQPEAPAILVHELYGSTPTTVLAPAPAGPPSLDDGMSISSSSTLSPGSRNPWHRFQMLSPVSSQERHGSSGASTLCESPGLQTEGHTPPPPTQMEEGQTYVHVYDNRGGIQQPPTPAPLLAGQSPRRRPLPPLSPSILPEDNIVTETENLLHLSVSSPSPAPSKEAQDEMERQRQRERKRNRSFFIR